MAEALATPAQGIQGIPGIKQGVLLLGIALAVSVGVAVVLWSQTPNFKTLYPNLDPAEITAIVGVLDSAQIPHKFVGTGTGLAVEASKFSEAQMILAGQGLPRSRGVSLDSLYEGTGYSTSQFMENKFYTHALENKLANIIGGMNPVKSSEVTLGIPKTSPFIRVKREPTASVVVRLFPGRSLDPSQVKAIVHLVASSVPELAPRSVTVLDQNSELISGNGDSDALGAAASQFDYKQRLEKALADNINSLLLPIMGSGRARTKVVAQLDFNDVEETTERFDPASQVIRSEQSAQRETRGAGAGVGGIPGALTNQPAAAPRNQAAADPVTGPTNTSTDRVLNYEVDRTISRTRVPKGKIDRLSVAVVLDYLPQAAAPGAEEPEKGKGKKDAEPEMKAQALPEELLEEIRGLIREAVGFDEARGDTLNLVNSPFQSEPEPLEAEPPAIWEQAWALDAAKLLGAIILVLLLILLVLKPLIQGLMQSHQAQIVAAAAPPVLPAQDVAVVPQKDPLLIAQDLASTDPKRIAQVVKDWVGDDE